MVPVLQTLADVLAQSVLSSGPLSSVLRQTLRCRGRDGSDESTRRQRHRTIWMAIAI